MRCVDDLLDSFAQLCPGTSVASCYWVTDACVGVQSKIQELSDQVTELTAKNASNAQQMQELAQVKNALEDALRNQGSQLKRISTEYMVLRARSVSNVFLPSSTIQFDPSEDVILKYPASTNDGVSEHVIVPSTDIQQYAPDPHNASTHLSPRCPLLSACLRYWTTTIHLSCVPSDMATGPSIP